MPMTEELQSGIPAPAHMSIGRQAALSVFWFASSAHWTAILITLLPLQALRMGGDAQKGTMMAIIIFAGALVSMLAAPLFGAWSDRLQTPWGRRKPLMVVGVVGNMVLLVVLGFLPATKAMLVPFLLTFMVLEIFNNLATAPYSALIPDLVPAAQRGSASGWMGLMCMLGNFVGGMCGLFMEPLGQVLSAGCRMLGLPPVSGITAVYLLLAMLLLLGLLITIPVINDKSALPAPPFQLGAFLHGWIEPFASLDFRWVFLTRFLVMLGIFTVQENLLFYIRDVIAGGRDPFRFQCFGVTLAHHAQAATSFFVLALLIGAIVSTLFAGVLSDRYGRKMMVYLSGALQGVVALAFLCTGRFDIVVILGLVFGLGYGAYQAVDWALATDVLPSAEDHAKDMGVWHIAVTLPQVLAAPIAGLLLDFFRALGQTHGYANMGYVVIFTVAVGYFALGTVFVRKIKGVR